jgi:protein-S-isoprenylcysteine O-methyltransferase Ste14
VTEIIRTEAPSESLTALLMVYVMVFFILFFSGLVVAGLILEWSPAWLSLWMGIIFVGVAVMVDLFRRNFLPDEMLVKVRLPKVVPRRKLRE